MTIRGLIPLVLVGLLVAGCQGTGTKQTVGGVTGAALGGLLGAQFGSGTGQLAATAAGAVIGGLLGSEVGKSLDRADRLYAQQAAERVRSAPLNDPIIWRNPESGNSGSFTAVRDGYTAGGEYCRRFVSETVVGGRRTVGEPVTMCRQPDGSWVERASL